MSKKLVLLGAGGFGREIIEIIEWIYDKDKKRVYELLGFLDDGEQFKAGDMINDYPWLGPSSWILDHKDEVLCTCTIGDAAIKARKQCELSAQGVHFESIIAPGAMISRFAEIGPGSVLYWNTAVSVDCKLGAGVVLNNGVKIGHDVTIGDYTCIMPDTGISGGCRIGEEVNIGGHAYVVPGKKIGDRARIAAGSVVFSNVRAGTTVLGNPAKRMKELE